MMGDTCAAMSVQAAVDRSPDQPPLLEAKLAKPRLRAGVIRRARLFDALDRLESTELTVISGPAGSAKTAPHSRDAGGPGARSARR